MEEKTKFKTQDITENLQKYLRMLNKFRVALFFIFVAIVYIYMFMQMNQAINQSPAANQVSQSIPPGTSLRIDPTIISQLESLSNNSVNVQTLFNQNRNNPFQ